MSAPQRHEPTLATRAHPSAGPQALPTDDAPRDASSICAPFDPRASSDSTGTLSHTVHALHSNPDIRSAHAAATLTTARPFAPPWRAYDRRDDSATWVRITLGCVVLGLLSFVNHIARTEARWTEATCTRAATHARRSLADLRAALARFHLEHRAWPGTAAAQNDDGSLERINAGEAIARSLEPLLECGIPVNPWNGSSTIRVLAPGSPWPATTDGRCGWIYRMETGEIRLDVPSEIASAGVRFYDL